MPIKLIFRFLPAFFYCLYSVQSIAQSTAEQVASMVILDSVVVTATKGDFSVADFIQMVQDDQSFYLAFQNFRASTCLVNAEMEFFDKTGDADAEFNITLHQIKRDDFVHQKVIDRKATGNFYKRKDKHRFYTYTLFDRLFLMADTVCGVVIDTGRIDFSGKGMEGHVAELKKLIFAPGNKSEVPFIGNKTAVFSDKMIDKYDFFIHSSFFQDTVPCYIFVAKVKAPYSDLKNNRTVIKELETYFSKSDFQVLSRKYRLAQFSAFYQFDVTMDISLQKIGKNYLPKWIQYSGFWNVPTKRRERATFKVAFSDMAIP